jgi:hypothetical protein
MRGKSTKTAIGDGRSLSSAMEWNITIQYLIKSSDEEIVAATIPEGEWLPWGRN